MILFCAFLTVVCLPRVLQEGSLQSIDLLAGIDDGSTFDPSQVWVPIHYLQNIYFLANLLCCLHFFERILILFCTGWIDSPGLPVNWSPLLWRFLPLFHFSFILKCPDNILFAKWKAHSLKTVLIIFVAVHLHGHSCPRWRSHSRACKQWWFPKSSWWLCEGTKFHYQGQAYWGHHSLCELTSFACVNEC